MNPLLLLFIHIVSAFENERIRSLLQDALFLPFILMQEKEPGDISERRYSMNKIGLEWQTVFLVWIF